MAKTTHISAQEHAASFSSKKRTIALIVVALAFVMDLLDSTIVNVAIPSIRTNLSASYSAIQWVVAGYSLTFALLLITGGRMGDVFGYKKIFMIGVGGFTIASLLSGLSQNPEMLIAARLLQGGMAALMVPQVMSLMQIMYKPAERGAINGLFGALGGMAASLGPVIGGLLIKANLFNWDWRPIFLINVPVGIFGLYAAARYLPKGKSAHPLKLDGFGTLLIMVALLLLIFPLIQGRDLGWPVWSILMMVASLPFMAWFVWWQRKKDSIDGSPLVLPALFKNRGFSAGLVVNLFFQAAMIGFFLTFGLLLQIGLGFTPIHAALTGLPVAIGIAFTMATLGEKVLPKLGRGALQLGAFIMMIGLITTSLVLLHYNLSIHSWQLIPGLLLVGCGMGCVFGSLFAAVLNGVDTRHAGSASGTLNAVQQVGAAIGVAVVGVIFFGQLTMAAPASFDTVKAPLNTALTTYLPGNAASRQQIITGTKQCFVDRSREKDSAVLPDSCKVTGGSQLPAKASAVIEKAALTANATNFDNAFRWTTIYQICILVFTFCLAYLLPQRFKTSAYKEI